MIVSLNVREGLAEEAGSLGLLSDKALNEMIEREIARQKKLQKLRADLDAARDANGSAMATEEIAAEVKAARAERRSRLADRS